MRERLTQEGEEVGVQEGRIALSFILYKSVVLPSSTEGVKH